MSHEQWLELFAKILAFCIGFLVIVDGGTEMNLRWANRLKWSMWWEVMRYVGMGCAVLLVISVLSK